MVRQSYPFIYIYLDLASKDDLEHHVEVYTDITGGEYLGIVINA